MTGTGPDPDYPDIYALDREAYEKSRSLTTREQLDWLLGSIGPRFTCASINVAAAATVRAWAAGDGEPDAIEPFLVSYMRNFICF